MREPSTEDVIREKEFLLTFSETVSSKTENHAEFIRKLHESDSTIATMADINAQISVINTFLQYENTKPGCVVPENIAYRLINMETFVAHNNQLSEQQQNLIYYYIESLTNEHDSIPSEFTKAIATEITKAKPLLPQHYHEKGLQIVNTPVPGNSPYKLFGTIPKFYPLLPDEQPFEETRGIDSASSDESDAESDSGGVLQKLKKDLNDEWERKTSRHGLPAQIQRSSSSQIPSDYEWDGETAQIQRSSSSQIPSDYEWDEEASLLPKRLAEAVARSQMVEMERVAADSRLLREEVMPSSIQTQQFMPKSSQPHILIPKSSVQSDISQANQSDSYFSKIQNYFTNNVEPTQEQMLRKAYKILSNSFDDNLEQNTTTETEFLRERRIQKEMDRVVSSATYKIKVLDSKIRSLQAYKESLDVIVESERQAIAKQLTILEKLKEKITQIKAGLDALYEKTARDLEEFIKSLNWNKKIVYAVGGAIFPGLAWYNRSAIFYGLKKLIGMTKSAWYNRSATGSILKASIEKLSNMNIDSASTGESDNLTRITRKIISASRTKGPEIAKKIIKKIRNIR